jgi:hypothetical protein
MGGMEDKGKRDDVTCQSSAIAQKRQRSNNHHKNGQPQHRIFSSSRLQELLVVGIPLLALELFLIRYHFLNAGSIWSPVEIDDSPTTERQPLSHFTKFTNRIADGTFNGYPVFFHDTTTTSNAPPPENRDTNDINELPYFYSSVHCVGGERIPEQILATQGDDDSVWMHRSCHFHFLCLDMETREYMLFQNPNDTEHSIPLVIEQRPLVNMMMVMNNASQSYTLQNQTSTTTSSQSFGVSLGGINRKWGQKHAARIKWFPEIVHGPPPPQFYMLPSNVVMIPFHSLAGFNPGHLLWDDFIPIYTLLHMFQLQQSDDYELLLIRQTLESPALWASCDWPKRAQDCRNMLEKFKPLMIANQDYKITNQKEAELKVNTTTNGRPSWSSSNGAAAKSNLVCAKNGLAGLGPLTDHGTRKSHGWEPRDYTISQNHGRGGNFWKFRDYMMEHLGILNQSNSPLYHEQQVPTRPYKIILSVASSETRSVDLRREAKILRESLDPNEVVVEEHRFASYTLKKQVEIVSDASIFVSTCGGGAVTSMFLPRGASLLLYFRPYGGMKQGTPTKTPARLDWDLFNALSYVRVHWLPADSKNNDLEALVQLVQHELGIVRREYSR